MIESVIFDMDGVLLDSEPFWQDAEMEVFASVGLHLTREQCIETTGLMVKDVVALRYKQKPWNHKSVTQVADEILNRVMQYVFNKAVPLDGVIETLEFFKLRKIPIALASSSGLDLIDTVLKKLSIADFFSIIHSAESERNGKPHPAVFLSTAERLHITPEKCLVIEDSFNGLIAAKAARMKTIVIPIEAQWKETRFDIADLKLRSLVEFDENKWKYLNTL